MAKDDRPYELMNFMNYIYQGYQFLENNRLSGMAQKKEPLDLGKR